MMQSHFEPPLHLAAWDHYLAFPYIYCLSRSSRSRSRPAVLILILFLLLILLHLTHLSIPQ